MSFPIGIAVATIAGVLAYWLGASIGEALIYQGVLMIYWEVTHDR